MISDTKPSADAATSVRTHAHPRSRMASKRPRRVLSFTPRASATERRLARPSALSSPKISSLVSSKWDGLQACGSLSDGLLPQKLVRRGLVYRAAQRQRGVLAHRLRDHPLSPITQLVRVLPWCWHNSTFPWNHTRPPDPGRFGLGTAAASG
jgi:hypothetical protein